MARPPPRGRSFRLLLAATFLGFGGYALLLPMVPLWAALGGAGALGAGTTTGVFMLATVGTQFTVPGLLRRLGHRAVLALGMVLLGGAAPLCALSADLPPLIGVAALRGIGFGLMTVTGSALTAELIPPAGHGRASARYGIAAGLPQLLLLPTGVVLAGQVGFGPLFLLAGALPLAGALIVVAVRVPRQVLAAPVAGQDWRAVRSSLGPWLAMLTCSVAQGGLITFLPLALSGSQLPVAVALLGTSAGALLGRLGAGELAGRSGTAGRRLTAGMGLTACGMLAEALAVLSGPGSGRAGLAIAGAAVIGIGFGIVQNDALVVMFAIAGAPGYGAASAAWNIAYDAGTGCGAFVLGAVAQSRGFAAAFGVSAALLVVGLPFAARTRQMQS
ncbi:MAG TPA: MFS transporter [Pseudonocardiaceae bacterium]